MLEKSLIKKSEVRKAPVTKSAALELFIELVIQDAHEYKTNRMYNIPDNIAPGARKALNDLNKLYKEKDIIIRPFDKGTGFFILNKEDYIERTLRLLSNTETYEIVNEETAATKAITEVEKWTKVFKKEKGVTENIVKCITPNIEVQNPGNIYINLKAHKPPLYPGRLITTGCNSYIENLSALTAHELKKVEIPYALMDTPHFLRKVDDLNDSGILEGKNIIHVSVDVVDMFPSIPKEFGMQECSKQLDKRTNPIFSTKCITSAIEITLNNNIGKFNDTTYRQKKGTAMGPKNACDYADAAMNYIDQAVHGNNPACASYKVKPIFWGRFRDDIYMPWIESKEKLLEFEQWINMIHPNLKFTFECSENGVEFLDLFVYSKDNKIHTKLYSKKSDTHSYLIPTSSHKFHVVKNIPYNTARRVLQNNSEKSNYETDKNTYINYLIDRGYRDEFVQESFAKIEEMDRITLYSKKDKNEQTICTPLVIDNNPALPPMNKIINKHKYILKLNKELNKTIKPENIFVSYRSNKTIKDMLIHNKLRNKNVTEENIDVGCYKCKTCYLCKWYMNETKTVTSYHTNQIFRIKSKITCDTKCVIYLVDCDIHKVSYVGYTTGNMKSRFSNDKSHIKAKKCTCEKVTHLINENHDLDFSNFKKYDESLSKCVSVTLIEKVKGINENDDILAKEAKCEKREMYWQRQLKTLTVYGGLNKRDGKKYST